MTLKLRDKAILHDLERFRAMTREHISQLHFSNLKNPVKETNTVLLRLKRDGYITVSKERRLYTYFPHKHIKKDSMKLNHYFAICDFYCELMKIQRPYLFEVEPRVDVKGGPEPDVLMIWKNTVFFCEIQRKFYSTKEWQEKMNRYETYFSSNKWKELSFQRDKPVFPVVWVIGTGKNVVKEQSFKCYHMSIEEMNQRLNERIKVTVKREG